VPVVVGHFGMAVPKLTTVPVVVGHFGMAIPKFRGGISESVISE
jgi:hypothetical protein